MTRYLDMVKQLFTNIPIPGVVMNTLDKITLGTAIFAAY